MKKITSIVCLLIAALNLCTALASQGIEMLDNPELNPYTQSKAFVKGIAAFGEEDYEVAEKWFRQEFIEHPDNAYAMCNHALAQYEKASANLLGLLFLNVDSLSEKESEEFFAKRQNEYTEAVTQGVITLEKGAEMLPTADKQSRARCYLVCATIGMDEEHESQVEDWLNRAVEINPSYETLSKRADYYYSKGDSVSQERDVLRAVELEPNNVEAIVTAAVLYLQNDEKKGMSYIKRALEVDPRNSLLLQVMALYSNQEGDYASALNYYNRAIECDTTGSAELYFGRGEAYENLGNKSEAATDVVAGFLRSEASEGFEKLQKAVLRMPDEVYRNLLRFSFKDKDNEVGRIARFASAVLKASIPASYKEGLELMNDYMSNCNSPVSTAMAFSSISMIQGDVDNGLKFAQKAVELADDSEKAEALINLAQTYYSLGDIDKLKSLSDEALEVAKAAEDEEHEIEAQIISADASLFQKDYDESIKLYEDCFTRWEQSVSPGARDNLARAYSAKGDKKKAKELYAANNDDVEYISDTQSLRAKVNALVGLNKKKEAKKELAEYDFSDELSRSEENEKPDTPQGLKSEDYWALHAACAYASVGELDNAFEMLDVLLRQPGFYSFGKLASYPGLAPLTSDSRFEQMINKYRERWLNQLK